jgi:hypothetical protein
VQVGDVLDRRQAVAVHRQVNQRAQGVVGIGSQCSQYITCKPLASY